MDAKPKSSVLVEGGSLPLAAQGIAAAAMAVSGSLSIGLRNDFALGGWRRGVEYAANLGCGVLLYVAAGWFMAKALAHLTEGRSPSRMGLPCLAFMAASVINAAAVAGAVIGSPP